MDDSTQWRWRFLGFESATEGRPVQDWFDGLPEDDRYEIADLLLFMQNVTSSLWQRPQFDPLDGEGGISEIRVDDIRSDSGVRYYRIYGYFGPDKKCYTLLHGTDKKVRNDREGKRIARQRMGQIERTQAITHEFNFEAGDDSETPKGDGNEE